MALYKK